MRKFTKEHEWVLIEGNEATIGITEHAAHELGDITFVELPVVGEQANVGEVLTIVESVKAASDVFSPVTGVISAANQELEGNPQLVNDSPEGEGWICKVKNINVSEFDGLMDEAEYRSYIESL